MPAICHVLFNIVQAIAISSPYHFENKPRAGTVAAVSIPGLLAINLTSPWSINSGQIWIKGGTGVSLNLATFICRGGANLCSHKSKYPSIYSSPVKAFPSHPVRLGIFGFGPLIYRLWKLNFPWQMRAESWMESHVQKGRLQIIAR